VSAPEASPVGPILYEARSVRLRAATEADYKILHKWRCDPGPPHFLCIDPSTVTYARFVQWLREYHRRGSIVLILNRSDNRAAGYALISNADLWDGWMFVATYMSSEFRASVHFLDASAIFVDYVFNRFPLRKILIEVYEFADRFREYMERRGWVSEGYTPKHSLYNDEYTGLHTLALYREAWEKRKQRQLPHLPTG
jgi:RimJ/RimL family protein N-acetyltransferase